MTLLSIKEGALKLEDVEDTILVFLKVLAP